MDIRGVGLYNNIYKVSEHVLEMKDTVRGCGVMHNRNTTKKICKKKILV